MEVVAESNQGGMQSCTRQCQITGMPKEEREEKFERVTVEAMRRSTRKEAKEEQEGRKEGKKESNQPFNAGAEWKANGELRKE